MILREGNALSISLDTILGGTPRLAIMSPAEFLHMYPKCESIYHAEGGWFTRAGLSTLLDDYPVLQGKRLGFIRRESDIPVMGGIFSADMYLIEEEPSKYYVSPGVDCVFLNREDTGEVVTIPENDLAEVVNLLVDEIIERDEESD